MPSKAFLCFHNLFVQHQILIWDLSMAPTSEWFFVLGLPRRSFKTILVSIPRLCEVITLCLDLQLGRGPRELSNGVSHSTCTHWGRVDSQLLVVSSQIANLTPDPFFCHNLCYRCPNGPCKAIFDI